MPLRRITIDEALASPEGLNHFDAVIDARSPSEFSLDHLPGAVNWPSLEDEERRLVGTEYKQVSPFEARKRGAVLVARNIARHLERETPGLPKSWRPLVYCWRGGQRSGSLALVLGQVGFDVHVLEGGYREFRRRVVADLEHAGAGLELRVLCGPTGSGKSYLARLLAEHTGGRVVEGSAWIRSLTGCWEHGAEAAAMLSRASQEHLARDPEISLRTLLRIVQDPPHPVIVVGLRNPVDFFGLQAAHGPGFVIRLTGDPVTEFERAGMAAIWAARAPDLILTLGQYSIEAVVRKIQCMS